MADSKTHGKGSPVVREDMESNRDAQERSHLLAVLREHQKYNREVRRARGVDPAEKYAAWGIKRHDTAGSGRLRRFGREVSRSIYDFSDSPSMLGLSREFGGVFGDGSVYKAESPAVARKTTREEKRNGAGRFTAEYKQKDFRDKWLTQFMAANGFKYDPQNRHGAHPAGYENLLRLGSAQYSAQVRKWDKEFEASARTLRASAAGGLDPDVLSSLPDASTAGDATAGDVSTGGTSTGDTSTGGTSTGDTSTGDTSTGDASTDDTTTDGASTDGASTDDASTDDSSTDDSSTPGATPPSDAMGPAAKREMRAILTNRSGKPITVLVNTKSDYDNVEEIDKLIPSEEREKMTPAELRERRTELTQGHTARADGVVTKHGEQITGGMLQAGDIVFGDTNAVLDNFTTYREGATPRQRQAAARRGASKPAKTARSTAELRRRPGSTVGGYLFDKAGNAGGGVAAVQEPGKLTELYDSV